ncbi:type IX secretion system sortase PorU [Bacteroidota bacterium]
MRLRYLYILVLFYLPVCVFGQRFSIEIDWVLSDSLIYFKNASFNQDEEMLPSYNMKIPWEANGKMPVVNVSIAKSSGLDPGLAVQIPAGALPSEPLLSYNIVYENKHPMLQISYLPLFSKEDGSIMKVEALDIEIARTEKLAALKSERKGRFAAQSLLSSHSWYKIAVESTGIHKLTYEQLEELGVSNPATVKLFGAGALPLPEDYSNGNYDDLTELPVYKFLGTDQLFGPGDYLLFFAQGPVSWKYNTNYEQFIQDIHYYSNRGYYFITDGLGPSSSPETASTVSDPADQIITTYDYRDFVEEESYNLLKSGREWFGDKFYTTLRYAYPFTIENLVLQDSVRIFLRAAGRSNETSNMRLYANSKNIGELAFSAVNLSNYTSTYAREDQQLFKNKTDQEILTLELEYLQPNSNSYAWLNYIALNARSHLRFTGDELDFRDTKSVSFGETGEFQLGNSTNSTVIWDVTTPYHPIAIPVSHSGDKTTFKASLSELREYIAFDPAGTFPEPVTEGKGLGLIANQDLHGSGAPDMLIVTTDELMEQAERLAEHRRINDNLNVLIVTQEMVFNEFSSGTPDVSALRNYLKMYYDKEEETALKYLLLFGDGSFDNRDTSTANPNLLLTYQSSNSLVPTSSYVSDDFFGLLDTGESLYDGLLDIGVGRMPASNIDEAKTLVDKIIEYDEVETMGEWRNFICLIGDDEDSNIHMKQANSLAEDIEENYPQYNINKIFLDAYIQETTPTGDLYPDVTRAINDQMDRGALIVNYTGHGGVTGLAHEKILDLTNIKAWRNKGKYPLFMTATCEFSRYDEYNASEGAELTSAGEEVLLNPEGGSIALFTTTRLVYSRPNHVLNERFYERVFAKKDNGDCYRLGDIIVYSKNNAGPGINKRNFSLLGDPSITLSFPKNVVITDSINHKPLEQSIDTISALEFVTISGHIEDQMGNLIANASGTVIPIVFDKKNKLTTLANDGGDTFEFMSRNNILYKGNVSVKNGRFKFSFYVPKDISYSIGQGKISYYALLDDTDGHGSTDQLTIGGLGDLTFIDTVGPRIELYMNDTLFNDGGIVNNDPELLVYIVDAHGINTTGNGIGHDITAMLNNDRVNSLILNEYYVYETDSYSTGTARYAYKDLLPGDHVVTVKVWDIFNNSAVASLNFKVVESLEMLLNEVYNYPNPFIDYTYFNVEHNRSGHDLDIVIRIYDLQGNLITVLEDKQFAIGNRLDPIYWSGNGRGGATIEGGLYVYKILIRTEEGEEALESGRLLIYR